jgi:L-ascorbate metabolism protein UlaG (beta-lactamase superfamily)
MKISRRRLIAGSGAVLAAMGGAAMWNNSRMRYYDGPVSDHFDGLRFFDPNGAPPNSLVGLLRFLATRERAPWPAWAASPFSDRPPRRVDGAAWRLAFVGHASWLLQTAGLNILIDPVWSKRVSPVSFAGPTRVNDPGIALDTLPPIDAVLVSHCHYDHLDLPTLSALASHRARLVMPLGNDTIARVQDPGIRAETHDWGDRIVLSRDVAVTLIPMRHWSARGLTDRNKALWAAFVIETPAGRIYHVADSGYGSGYHFRTARERYGPFRLAILPIGAYEPRWFMREQHMNPDEAVLAFADCGAELALGHHFGTFQLTDEAIDAPTLALAAARAKAGLAADRFRTMRPGEIWEL